MRRTLKVRPASEDCGAQYYPSGEPLVRVPVGRRLQRGQYSFDTKNGMFTFSTKDQGAAIVVSCSAQVGGRGRIHTTYTVNAPHKSEGMQR